jgi:hypothetical protein
MTNVTYEEINGGRQIQVFVDDYFAGTLIKTFYPDKPDPQGTYVHRTLGLRWLRLPEVADMARNSTGDDEDRAPEYPLELDPTKFGECKWLNSEK